jgi:hypothetical protein
LTLTVPSRACTCTASCWQKGQLAGVAAYLNRDLIVSQQVPVTVLRALCDLTGVILSYPGRGGAAVPDSPGSGVWNSKGFGVQVDAHTQDVTVAVSGTEGNA